MISMIKQQELSAPSRNTCRPVTLSGAAGREGILSSERGIILELTAISALLLVILIFGFAIDLPFTHATVIRGQNALDIGATHGIFTYQNSNDAAWAAFANADAVLKNEYTGNLTGQYAPGFASEKTEHVIFIPKVGRPNNAGNIFPAYSAYQCTGGSSPSCNQGENGLGGLDIDDSRKAHLASIISRTFDVGSSIDDFRNAVMFYARFTPFHFLPILPDRTTEVLSVARLQNVMSYVLIDPAMSINNQDNYNLIFGGTPDSDGTNDSYMWPVAGWRKRDLSGAEEYIYPVPRYKASGEDWATLGYPSISYANLFYNHNPLTGSSFATSTDPNWETQLNRIYHFYASSCDTLPFFFFKSAAVNLIDRLSNSSAFNSTMMIGLTGYGHGPSLVPIFPANVAGLIAEYPGAEEYPLPLRATEDHNEYAHLPKPAAFNGFVNPTNADPTLGTTPTGVNQWDLCYCRGLYGKDHPSSSTIGFMAPEDFSGGDDDAISHVLQSKRVRDTTQGGNWCDDSPVTPAIDMWYGRSGSSVDTNSETPRNMVGNLAIRARNPNIQAAQNPLTWSPPNLGTYGNGYRDLPTAITEACNQLKDATNHYNELTTDYGVARPVTKKALQVFAFGVYSKDTPWALSATNPKEEAKTQLANAIKSCSCGDPTMMLFLAFLPLDEVDREQVDDAMEVIKDFETDFNYSSVGQNPGSLAYSCDSGHASAVYAFPYDYMDSRFTDEDPNPALSNYSVAKLEAAKHFSEEVYLLISRLMIEYVFPG
jgi:hypothetical protein